MARCDFVDQHRLASDFIFAGIEWSFGLLVLDQLDCPEHANAPHVADRGMLCLERLASARETCPSCVARVHTLELDGAADLRAICVRLNRMLKNSYAFHRRMR
jgi:hypothetical protein